MIHFSKRPYLPLSTILTKVHKELIQEIENQIQDNVILKTDYEKTGNFKIEKMIFLSERSFKFRHYTVKWK